jgi:hypothetical protein
MLIEIVAEINELHDRGVIVTKISFIGYSLGGLISRFIIGELEKMSVFETIEPMFFCTFATPHMGVWFFKKRFSFLNLIGSNVLGFVGSELFINDRGKLLVQLSDGDYLNGLSKFKERFCFANIRHDRTVNFYTSYITDKNPFDSHWNQLDLSFDSNVPRYKIRGMDVKPKIVDLQASKFLNDSKPKYRKPLWKKLRYFGIILLASVVLPIWIPIVFVASSAASIVSWFIVKFHKKSEIQLSLDNGSSGASIKERLEEVTGEALETAINMGQYDSNTESTNDPGNGKIFTTHPLQSLEYFNTTFQDPNTEESLIFKDTKPLPVDSERKYIMDNLNSLSWFKFGVYVNVLNAHDGIVARKGLERSTTKGIATIRFFGELLNEKIKDMRLKN